MSKIYSKGVGVIYYQKEIPCEWDSLRNWELGVFGGNLKKNLNCIWTRQYNIDAKWLKINCHIGSRNPLGARG